MGKETENTMKKIGDFFSDYRSKIYNFALTLIGLFVIYLTVPPFIQWAIIDADFFVANSKECTSGGACWGVITSRFPQYIYGFYPKGELYRPTLAFFLLLLAFVPIVFSEIKHRNLWFAYSVIFPFIAGWLIFGGLGLPHVASEKIGGFLLTVILGVTGITFSLPLGIMLALARRSKMPVVRIFAVMFIEFIRGVPMIGLLFVAVVMLLLFLPSGTNFDQLARVIFIVVIFASAYVAEVVRGGLQSLPKGQVEASYSLGVGYFHTTIFIVLPQALKVSIPGLISTFIGLFKDTTLVIIVGMFDLLGIGKAALADRKWLGLSTEVYVFIAILFFICCFSMAKYSTNLEAKLDKRNKS